MSSQPLESVVYEKIIAFSQYLSDGPLNSSPFLIALRRNWIDRAGRPTSDGVALVEALSEQDGARSAFRLSV